LITVGSAQGSPGTTLEDALREHDVTDQSEQSLIAHLQSSDRVVRGLAANKLATDGRLDDIPAIESALSAERELSTQIQLAQALWVLHDPKGVDHLHSMCVNSSLRLSGLTAAVQTLQIIHVSSGECAATLMAAMGGENEPSNLAVAASTLPVMYREVTPNQAKAIFILIRALFVDVTQQPYVRLLAGQALAQIRTPEAAELLQREISLEVDPTIREDFERDLKEIEKNR
jgi:HEAT repeat protein